MSTNYNMEPDGVIPTVSQAAKARSSDELLEPRQSSTSSRPQRKPDVPESGTTANSMARLLTGTSSVLKGSGDSVNASSFKADHPYGDNGHGMGTGHALDRLGAGKTYGQ